MLFAATTETTILVISILGSIALVFLLIFIMYLIIASRRASITLKKIDYLVEDLTYKSQMLNSSVELTNKVTKYLDGLDSVFKGGIKSTIKILIGNKDFFQSSFDKIKEILFLAKDDESESASESEKEKISKKNTSSNKGGKSKKTLDNDKSSEKVKTNSKAPTSKSTNSKKTAPKATTKTSTNKKVSKEESGK
ncbi:MAG: hypothetical protein HRS57_02515 [Mycoplasmataceae bacterium]|nr:hypothetical protein [Mycoplasmataceae bacterium]